METILISFLSEYLYCPRRIALKAIEGIHGENEHTLAGSIEHEHVDFPGYEQRAGYILLRALPLYSQKLHLSGKADLVEIKTENKRVCEAQPVEYKHGRKRSWDNDNVQLCAQAICLEEMFELDIPRGWVFHAQSQARREVHFTSELRDKTISTLENVRTLLEQQSIPGANLTPRCDGCSLRTVCLPGVSKGRLKQLSTQLFEPIDNVKH